MLPKRILRYSTPDIDVDNPFCNVYSPSGIHQKQP